MQLARRRQYGVVIFGHDVFFKHFIGQCTVHFARAQKTVTQLGRYRFSDGRLARSGRSVNGNQHSVYAHTYSVIASRLPVTPRIANIMASGLVAADCAVSKSINPSLYKRAKDWSNVFIP